MLVHGHIVQESMEVYFLYQVPKQQYPYMFCSASWKGVEIRKQTDTIESKKNARISRDKSVVFIARSSVPTTETGKEIFKHLRRPHSKNAIMS